MENFPPHVEFAALLATEGEFLFWSSHEPFVARHRRRRLLRLSWSLAQAQVPISVYPNPISFGTVALNSQSYPLTVYISNVSVNSVDITSVTVSGTNAADYVISSAPCVGTIGSNSSCELYMIFTPSAMGARVASLVVAVSGLTTPVSVPLQGTGGNPIPTIITVSPANIYAGSPATTITMTGTGFISSSVASIQNISLLNYLHQRHPDQGSNPRLLSRSARHYSLTVTNPAPAGGSGFANVASDRAHSHSQYRSPNLCHRWNRCQPHRREWQ